MNSQVIPGYALYEHRFWLQILGDHSRFIFMNLGVTEKSEIERADKFITEFDQLLGRAQQGLGSNDVGFFNKQVFTTVKRLKAFKLHLIRRHLTEKISIHMQPSFLNHMVNELEEYEIILRALESGRPLTKLHPIHYHLIWLLDAIGHAASLACAVDLAERDLRLESQNFEQDFIRFHNKAQELAGNLRTDVLDFPAFGYFNRQVNQVMLEFMSFLTDLRDLSIRKEVLGTLTPLTPDHMLREECYYLNKLAEITELQPSKCDPTAPRIES